MKRFILDLKHYYRYIFYSAKSTLKQEVADSFLNWGWLIINPVMFALVYAFVQIVMFGNTTDNLASFLFVGLTCWNFFQACIGGSVRLIKRYEPIISKTYVPKFAFVISNLLVNGFKMMVSFGLILLSLIWYGIPFSPRMFWSVPYLLLLFLICFGLSCILMHFGVYLDDLANIVPIALRMLFFLSGVFYNLEGKLSSGLGVLVERINPAAFVIMQMRRVLIYDQPTNLPWFFLWIAVGVVLSVVGVHLIYKYERSYVKTV